MINEFMPINAKDLKYPLCVYITYRRVRISQEFKYYRKSN